MSLPTLETERLRIRPLTMEDAETYHRAIHGDDDVMRFLPSGTAMSLEYTQHMIGYFTDHAAQFGFSFEAIIDKNSGAFIGHVGLHQLSDAVEIGYALGKAYWGAGYATEAARAMMGWGFAALKLDSIIALAYPQNIASRRVMERLGMTYRGEIVRYYGTQLSLYRILKSAFIPTN